MRISKSCLHTITCEVLLSIGAALCSEEGEEDYLIVFEFVPLSLARLDGWCEQDGEWH